MVVVIGAVLFLPTPVAAVIAGGAGDDAGLSMASRSILRSPGSLYSCDLPVSLCHVWGMRSNGRTTRSHL